MALTYLRYFYWKSHFSFRILWYFIVDTEYITVTNLNYNQNTSEKFIAQQCILFQQQISFETNLEPFSFWTLLSIECIWNLVAIGRLNYLMICEITIYCINK